MYFFACIQSFSFTLIIIRIFDDVERNIWNFHNFLSDFFLFFSFTFLLANTILFQLLDSKQDIEFIFSGVGFLLSLFPCHRKNQIQIAQKPCACRYIFIFSVAFGKGKMKLFPIISQPYFHAYTQLAK